MAVKLKKLKDQVMVITGASSGIGLTTARLAAKAGARLVLAARSEQALRQLTNEINRAGSPAQAVYVVADVSHKGDVEHIAQVAQQRFGGFDTWVNNAGTSVYGRIDQHTEDDMRQIFETNFWGLVHGSMLAARHLKRKGGAIINVGSILSDLTAILQSVYSASKHAVKGFTDGLRMELEMEGAPISVTLIQPAAIDTPFTTSAKNYLDRTPKHAPPAYAPDTVARAIVHAAQKPTRDVVVGGGGKAFISMEHWTPGLLDKFMETGFAKMEHSDEPPRPREQNGLDRPMGALQERGNYPGYTRETSFYTSAVLSPVLTTAALLGAGAGLAVWLNRSKLSSGSAGNGHASAQHGEVDSRKDYDISLSSEPATATAGHDQRYAEARREDLP
ncbi:SDR family oxidoreductase [uncultured Hymenobacter sp.]|uniref:SDR family oxidoreductase n=1 Tax=uncultured Hymenobacter sp. TaxID=170016 RepID=UPI0035CA7BA2